ncbi:MAG: hypothetical protein QM756_12170 [Polyangiaceae bacterium]
MRASGKFRGQLLGWFVALELGVSACAAEPRETRSPGLHATVAPVSLEVELAEQAAKAEAEAPCKIPPLWCASERAPARSDVARSIAASALLKWRQAGQPRHQSAARLLLLQARLARHNAAAIEAEAAVSALLELYQGTRPLPEDDILALAQYERSQISSRHDDRAQAEHAAETAVNVFARLHGDDAPETQAALKYSFRTKSSGCAPGGAAELDRLEQSASRTGDRLLSLKVLRDRAALEARLARPERALALVQQAMDLARPQDPSFIPALAELCMTGYEAALSLGDPQRALQLAESEIALRREIPDARHCRACSLLRAANAVLILRDEARLSELASDNGFTLDVRGTAATEHRFSAVPCNPNGDWREQAQKAIKDALISKCPDALRSAMQGARAVVHLDIASDGKVRRAILASENCYTEAVRACALDAVLSTPMPAGARAGEHALVSLYPRPTFFDPEQYY